ncbi:MAG: hypothetical protein V3S41_00295 [Spirochaetia bacterium]
MRGSRYRVLIVLLTVCLQSSVLGQEFSERQEIAIFRLSYYGQPISESPANLKVEIRGRRSSVTLELRGSGDPQVDQLFIRTLGAVDERIRSTFINLGRFDIIGVDQRLTQQGVDDFIDLLTEFKRSQTELPEAVLLGQATFTEADFQRLVGGFVVVVPSVSWYSLTRQEDGSSRAEIETSFSFINVENLTTFDQFFITTSGVDDVPETAVKEATDAITSELSFRLRSMSEFQIKTGILEVSGREVVVEFGRNMGLRPGDEYAIVSNRVLSSGHIAGTETGLIVISEVQNGFSIGHVLYSNPRAMVGDQLQEIARRGIELSGYVDAITNGLTGVTYTVGARAVASRGFYAWRPLGAVEIPFRGLLGETLLPMNMLLGGEWNLYLGRLKVTPSVAVGIGGAVPLSSDDQLQSFYLSHYGGQIRATGSVLITRDIQLFVETGFVLWRSVYDNSVTRLIVPLSDYGGLLIGGGITFK